MYTQHTTWQFRWACNAIVRLSFSSRTSIPHSSFDAAALYSTLLMEDNFQLQKECNLTLPIQTRVENGAQVVSSCILESSFLSLASYDQIMALVVRYTLKGECRFSILFRQ